MKIVEASLMDFRAMKDGGGWVKLELRDPEWKLLMSPLPELADSFGIARLNDGVQDHAGEVPEDI